MVKKVGKTNASQNLDSGAVEPALVFHREQRARREKEEKTKPVSIRVPIALLERLQGLIDQESKRLGGKGPTLSEFILDLIQLGLGKEGG